MDTLQALYDSEINYGITTLWDAGFDVVLGLSTAPVATTSVKTVSEAVEWLRDQACKHFPTSVFAAGQA